MAYRVRLRPGAWWVPLGRTVIEEDLGVEFWDALERCPHMLRPLPQGESGWTWLGRVHLQRELAVERWELRERLHFRLDVAHPGGRRSPLERFFVGSPGGSGRFLGRLLAAWPVQDRAVSTSFGEVHLWLRAPEGVIASAFAHVARAVPAADAIAHGSADPWPWWLWQMAEAPRHLDVGAETFDVARLELPPALVWLHPATFCSLPDGTTVGGLTPLRADARFASGYRTIPGLWLLQLDLSWSRDLEPTRHGRRLARVDVLGGAARMPFPHHDIDLADVDVGALVAIARAWPAGWKFLVPLDLPGAIGSGLFHTASERHGSFVVTVDLPDAGPRVIAEVVRILARRRAAGHSLGSLTVEELASMAALCRLAGEGAA